MHIRPYVETYDYPALITWWEKWQLPLTPPRYLPQGMMVEDENGKRVCVGFLFRMSATPLFWIEGIVSEPSVDRAKKAEGLELLVKGLGESAKAQGCELLMGSTPREGLKQVFVDAGYTAAPEAYFHLGRII
jgi:hypothetical protein